MVEDQAMHSDRFSLSRLSGIAAAVAVGWLLAISGCGSSPEERRSEIYELRQDPTPENLLQIRILLEDQDRDVRATALHVLVVLSVPDATDLAIRALEDPDGFVRKIAAKSLEELGDSAAVPALARRLLEDEDPRVRRTSAIALTAIGGEEAARELMDAMEDPMKEVRLEVVKGVARLDPSGALDRLATLLLQDPDWEIRVQAAAGLGRSGQEEAIPAMEEAAKNDLNEFVRAAATKALKELE